VKRELLFVNGRPAPAHQPASWTTTALYQQAVFSRSLSRLPGRLDNKYSRSTVKFERTSHTAQHYARKTPDHLRATFDTMLLLRVAERVYAHCFCCCNRRTGSARQGTPLAHGVFCALQSHDVRFNSEGRAQRRQATYSLDSRFRASPRLVRGGRQ
jgi:hypothetical protein